MITHQEISEILARYDESRISFATMCSHSALQIFHGARLEGFRTIGICTPSRRRVYEAFPLAKPDVFIEVREFADVLNDSVQQRLRELNAVVVPHGSFVEYVGAEKLLKEFAVPMFGNRLTLEWEGSREKMYRWLGEAGVELPREVGSPSRISSPCLVKFPGAKGGKGMFVASSPEEFKQKVKEMVSRGLISPEEAQRPVIQELVVGVRYYPHFFYTPLFSNGYRVADGRLELLGIDRRIESNIDELHRVVTASRGGSWPEPSYVVTGNLPMVVREALLEKLFDIASSVVEASLKLFPPGMIGPFCVETICTPDLDFVVFEVSARIVAGTNLYPMGSPYSHFLFDEPMSTGRRIAREVREASKRGRLSEVIY